MAAKFKVGDKFKLEESYASFVKGSTITLIVVEDDGIHRYRDEKGDEHFLNERRLKPIDSPRVEYTLPQHKRTGKITLDNVHTIIKGAICSNDFMGGCVGTRNDAGCEGCVFGGITGTKDSFYQMIIDMAEQENDNG